MTSKIKQVGRGAGIDKLTTQIHHFLEQSPPPSRKLPLGSPLYPQPGGKAGAGGQSWEGGTGRRRQARRGSVRETLYPISFDIQSSRLPFHINYIFLPDGGGEQMVGCL